ncbi:MAG: hypothetical protein K2M53_11210 [Muribaculaceae bacterium]|nr:hypothetical protein [Muribaculaceae bacterium]
MGNFFGSIYCWFESFFGIELADYLWGVSSSQSNTNQFIGIGLWMLGISLFTVILYYYIINHPRLCSWWGWGIFLLLNAVINFFVGWQWVLADSYEGKMVRMDPSTNLEVPLNISSSEMLCFGVSNMILSILAFSLFTLCLKWWSKNCSSAPF